MTTPSGVDVRSSPSHAVMKGRLLLVIIVLVVVFVLGPIGLHFAQKRHDRLPFDVMTAYPPDATFASGEIFATTLAAIMNHELSGLSGWRPNDFVLWGPRLWADNNANRQLGIIQAVRESTRIFRDNLTKVSATEFDQNLVDADTAFRNDATKFWLPSAEGKFRNATASLDRYVVGLKTTPPTSKPINRRNIELIRLLHNWTDMLGDAHGMLFKGREESGSSIPPWRIDDYFYRAQGVTHVLHHLTLAVIRGWGDQFRNEPIVGELLDDVADALGAAARLKPIVVLDSSPASLFANHRRNLDGYVVEARQKLISLREELEK